MDIEELRRRAMASMPHKKKRQQPQPQSQSQQRKVSSDPQTGKSPADNLFDASVIQTPVISYAPSAPSFNGSRKERDVFLSTLHDLHPPAICPAAEEKDDNLVIRFSDGESDSDSEENLLKVDERHGDVSFRGNIIGSSATHSPAASSQMIPTTSSQHTPGMWNQMAMMKRQLAAVRTSMSSAIQVRGDGPTWKSSSKQKHVIGQKGLIGHKRGGKPGASVTRLSGDSLDNLRKKIAIKGGTDLENLRKQIATKGGMDLENLRKQIATKENELKLQRHMKSGKGQGMVSVPNGKLHIPGIGEPTAVSTGRQLSISPASLKLAGTSDKETGEEKPKVLQVTMQELPDVGLKVNINSLQQQRRNTLNTDTEYNCVKDGSIDNDPITDLHSAGSKRSHTDDNPVGQKYQKVDIDERNIESTQPVSDFVKKHRMRVESNIKSSNFSMSMPVSTLSKRVMSEDFHHTNISCLPEREGNKKCKVDGLSMGSGNYVNLSPGQSSAKFTPERHKHGSVEGFQNNVNNENVQFISREGEEVQMEIEETERLLINESVKTAYIENCSQKINLAVEQSIMNCWKNDKEDMDGSSVQASIEEGCFDLTYGSKPAGPACENMSTSETSGDVPRGEQKTGVPIIFTSREVVEWEGSRGPLSNTRAAGIHIQDDLLQSGNISLQNLMKEEEVVDKELEEAREHRSRCEMEETIAWKAYRKAQTAVQAANQRCIDLHKKRASLSAQVRSVALRNYSSQGSPERVEDRKEGFYEPQSFSGHKNLRNMADITSSLQERLESSEQPGCKLIEQGSIVDYAIISSSQPCIANNWSSSQYDFQSVQQKSNCRLPMADVVPNAAKESCMDDKNIDQGKIYGSVSSGVVADQDQDIVSCEPELLFETSERKNKMEGKHAVSRESTLKVTEAFQRCRSKLSENMEACKSSEHGLRREDTFLDSIMDTTVENDENCELMPKLSITPEILSDEKNPAVDKTGEPDFEQATTKCNLLPQKRKWSNQIPASDFGADGPGRFSHTSVSTEKTKEEGTAIPCAETSAESLHGQNYDQECSIQFPVQKHEEFADACPESLERLLEVPEEVVKTTTTTTVGHFIDDDVHGNSAGTCHSENSLASGIVCEKTNNKRFATTFSSLKGEKVNFEENNEEMYHSGSSFDEGCATEKENTAVWKNSIEEQAPSGNSGGYPDCEQPKLSDLTMVADINGRSIASDVAYMENQDSMQQIVCAYAGQKTLGKDIAQKKIQAVNRKNNEDASSQPPESDFWMASSELRVVFGYAKEILSNSYGILGSSRGKMTQLVLQDSLEYVPKFLLYESPLDMFKSYNIYNNLIAADGVPNNSTACSHVINPFWPLCKFEHRGKCNNEDCPWQHARDYSLTPTQFVEQLKKHSITAGDCKEFNSHGNQDPQTYFEITTKEAITRGFKIHFEVTADQSVVSQGFSCRNISSYGLIVPLYRIGSHLIKADVPIVGALIARNTWRFWKLGFCQSFSIPFAIQRIILSDMPYLRSAAVREWMLGNNSRLPTCLYSSNANPDDTKKHLFRGLENVECWLELAIDSMNFDSNIDKSDGRKRALCVLSRAIEANPNSVALWVVYLQMFYRKEKVIGKDDMFRHAVQQNEGSYELWLLFINSRLQMDQRLEAYKNAIALLCSKACASETQDKSGSPYVLDLVLQMLNFLSLSGYKQKAMTWIDKLLFCSTEASNNGWLDFISVSTVLACLTRKDACVLWVSCTYFRVYKTLPKAIVEQLEFEQNLPFDVEWHSCHLSEALIDCTIKSMNNAVLSLNECHDQCVSQSWHNDSNFLLPVHALVINHVKCVSAIEGLMSACKLCCRYRALYPSCVELVLISLSMASHSGDDGAGIALFDESLSKWPEGKPGIQRLWNQYVGYVLESKGVTFAKDIINKWFCYMDKHKMLDIVMSFRGTDNLPCSPLGHALEKHGVEGYKDERKQAHDCSVKTGLDKRSWCQDMVFALLNLAIYRLLNDDPKNAESAVDKALKVALDDGDVKHCIRECAALTLFSVPDELELMKNGFDTRMLHLLDKCFLRSRLFPIPKPLSRAFTESIKKPKIRIFIENLLGPIPVDCSILNSILEIWYGPSLLPENFGAFKDLVDFLEGLLELAPANLKLVLSISRMIVRRCNSQNISSMAALFWASSLLINSIFQSFPVAPENAWLEVGNFLELLDVDVIREEFYQQALSVHPFSVALWHSFLNFRRRTENLAGVVEAAKQRGIIID